jgi:hypothetical protein
MTISVTWEIEQLQAAPTENGLEMVVKTAHWRANASDTESRHTATAYGSVGLDNPDPASFIPYQDLTKEDAIAAVKAKLDEGESGQVAQIESNLAGEINKKKNPPIVTSTLPW